MLFHRNDCITVVMFVLMSYNLPLLNVQTMDITQAAENFMRESMHFLCDKTTNISTMLTLFRSQNVIDECQRQDIESKSSDYDRFNRLYTIIMQKIFDDNIYPSLLQTLEKSGNTHILKHLQALGDPCTQYVDDSVVTVNCKSEFDLDVHLNDLKTIGNRTVEEIVQLNISLIRLWELIAACRRLGEMETLQKLQKVAKTCFGSISDNTECFMQLSLDDLKTLISSDELEMKESDIFFWTLRWAEEKCISSKLAITPENLRSVLGEGLYEIRFPLMSLQEFAHAIKAFPNILNDKEKLMIYSYFGLPDEEKPVSQLSPFKTNPRNAEPTSPSFFVKVPETSAKDQDRVVSSLLSDCCVLTLANNFPIVDATEDGNWLGLQCNHKIALHGLRFYGPVDTDATFTVTVIIIHHMNRIENYVTNKLTTPVFAKKGKAFDFIFDEPVIIKQGSVDAFLNPYNIYYDLKGPKTRVVQRLGQQDSLIQAGDAKFRLRWYSNRLEAFYYQRL